MTKPIFALADGALKEKDKPLGRVESRSCDSWTLYQEEDGEGSGPALKKGCLLFTQFPGICYICSNYYELWDTSVTRTALGEIMSSTWVWLVLR